MNETNRVASRFPASSKGRGLCGWLMKRGGRVQTWKKRWFVVVGDQLFYYRTPSDPRAREAGFIPLPGNQVVRHPFDPRHPDKHMFEIVAGDRRLQVRNHESFMLSAESVEELETWISAINRIIREPLGGGMFGREVGRTVKQEARRSGGGYVPLVVQTTVSFLRQKGLDELGIFRLPGNQVKVQGLKELFDKGEHPDLQSCDEVHSVASLLKLYLRELPEPLIPFEYFDMFISAACVLEKDEAEGLQQVEKQLKLLPTENINLLKFLCDFLFELQTHSQSTKMDLANLATVFGPNFIRPQSKDPQTLMENTSLITILTKTLIKYQQKLFEETDTNQLSQRDQVHGSHHLNAMTLSSDSHLYEYEEYTAQRCGTAPSGSLRRDKPDVGDGSLIEIHSDSSPSTFRRQTVTATLSNGTKLKKPVLQESSDTDDDAEDDTHTQNFELKQLRKEVQQLKKDQQQTCKLVDKLQAELDLERKARTSAEESLQNKQTTLESNQKMMREDMERQYKELQKQFSHLHSLLTSS